jgi:cytochrome c553
MSVLFIHCGSNTRDIENYGDILSSPGGMKISGPSEHRGGYGRTACVVCHNIELNVHRGKNSPVNPETLNKDYETKGREAYCMTCHGKNGTDE